VADLRVLRASVMQANMSLQTRFSASRWHRCCRGTSGDLGMSPFRGQLSGKRAPASTNVTVLRKLKHKGESKI
jgi:hypothetical protein